jgi:hypothetical protein
MKKIICLAASLLALNFTPVFGQPAPPATILPQPPTTFSQHVAGISAQAEAGQVNAAALTKFNLDFPGGTPKELVAAIEKAMGKPLNAIIPTEDAGVDLPPLKMSDVDVARLFKALQLASMKQVAVVTSTYGGNSSYSTYNLDYGFMTDGQPFPSDNSVWYFHADKPVLPPMNSTQNICQFYSLSPYLDRGFTVDDITTAIQTGWKMAGVSPTPDLNYHKETKLLIAFGEPDKLKTIDDVLKTLPSSNVTLATAKDYATALQETYNKMQETHNQIVELAFKVERLEGKITKLTSSTNSVPAEKSGK